jgi:hypothetical protein
VIFMLLFYSDEKAIAAMSPAERNRLVEAHVAYDHDFLRKRCTMLANRALQPSFTAMTVSPDGVTPGPAVLTDPPLTGFYLIDCADADEAVELARGYPMPDGLGRIEVRAVIQEWDYAPTVETAAPPEAVWRQYVDVASWPAWKHAIERAELDGPFVAGATGRLVVTGRPPMPYRIVSATSGQGYVSETELGEGIALRIEHMLVALPGGGTRITHRANVPRAALDLLGHEFSPALNDGIRRTLRSLSQRVESD